MKPPSTQPPERPRPRDPREEREPSNGVVLPLEHIRLFTQLFAEEGGGAGAGASLAGKKAVAGAAMIEALTEQLTSRVQAASQWPLQAVLYLPRLGRINASVRREQGAWNIELEAEQEDTAHWLSGVRQSCQDRCASALGMPVTLHLPNVGAP